MKKLIIEIIDDRIKDRFKAKCARLGTTQKKVITSLIEEWIKNADNKK